MPHMGMGAASAVQQGERGAEAVPRLRPMPRLQLISATAGSPACG